MFYPRKDPTFPPCTTGLPPHAPHHSRQASSLLFGMFIAIHVFLLFEFCMFLQLLLVAD
jgi:hypothetical protein